MQRLMECEARLRPAEPPSLAADEYKWLALEQTFPATRSRDAPTFSSNGRSNARRRASRRALTRGFVNVVASRIRRDECVAVAFS